MPGYFKTISVLIAKWDYADVPRAKILVHHKVQHFDTYSFNFLGEIKAVLTSKWLFEKISPS